MEDFMINEIEEFIKNTECEEYTKLTDEEVHNIALNIIDNVMLDEELNRVITETIEWYVNKEVFKEVD